jgi:hypothetical protein
VILRKIGKQGRINANANRKLKKAYMDKGYVGQGRCEVLLDGCSGSFGVGYAHRHSRSWYYKQPELLSEYNQTVLACTSCHSKLEPNKELTIEIFTKIRG